MANHEAWIIFDVENATSGNYTDDEESVLHHKKFESEELKEAYFRGFEDVVENAPFVNADDIQIFDTKEDGVDFVRENS